MIWLLLSCTTQSSNKDTSVIAQDPQLENGFCTEPEMSKVPEGTVDLLETYQVVVLPEGTSTFKYR